MSSKPLSLHRTVAPTSRSTYRWLSGLLVVAVIALGWRYPHVGLVVPLVMLTGMVGGLWRGRYVCGNICPRGGFLDTWFANYAGRREVPSWLKGRPFRSGVMVLLMTFLAWRIMEDHTSLAHIGTVFWQMCLITTVAALGLGLLYRERAWCVICPMGFIQSLEGGGKYPLQVASSCRNCTLCERHCPMSLAIAHMHVGSEMSDADCLKCSQCVKACPANALSWPDSRSAA